MLTRYLFRLSFAILLLASFCSLRGQGVIPQVKQDVPDRELNDSVQILPFNVTAITDAFNKSNNLITESGNLQITEEAIAEYKGEVDSLFVNIDQFLGDSSTLSIKDMGLRELNLILQRSDFFNGELSHIQDRITNKTRQFRGSLSELTLNTKRWELTKENYTQGEVLEERLKRIDRTIVRIDSVQGLLLDDLGQLVNQQDRLSDKIYDLERLNGRVKDQKDLLGEQLFRRDAPDLFGELSKLSAPDLLENHIAQMKRELQADKDILSSDFLSSILFLIFLTVLFLGFGIWYKKQYASQMSVKKFELSKMQLSLISSPVVTSIFMLTILIRFIHPDLPRTFAAINLLLMMVPLMILVIRLFVERNRTWIMVLLILFSLTLLYDIFYYPDIVIRILLLGFSLTGLALFIWLYVKEPLTGMFSNQRIHKIFRIIITFFSALLFIAIIANLIGAFSLAEYFTLLPIQIAILAIVILTLIKVADTLIFLILASDKMQRFNVIRDEFQVIYTKSVGLADLFLWLFFFSTALKIFRIRDAVFGWGSGVLTNGIKIGEVNITLGSILIFIFVIWLSIMITRMLSHILEKDVFTRVKTGKGVPSTIILLMRIVLISGGFFLAAKAAGMALTNLSIVLGAFSVGIGFGLQNIFNNMVSGLILAFERPIKVGDVVQVGELTGTVLSIGLRSSTVRSFDGAEVIVPNGNLISNEMINWTKSDANRRMDIRVGVAYGTNPEAVVGIMEEIALGHQMVDKDPAPRAYFIGFGDSSLDFRLLAWTNLDHRLGTESEINISINQKLAEAGIEIPFPQTDLHIRSDDTKSSK